MQCGHSNMQALPVTFSPSDPTPTRELALRLDVLNAMVVDMIAALPVGPVEPIVLLFDVDKDTLLYDMSAIGTVIAPRGVLARHVEVGGLPKYARPDRSLQFELTLSADYPSTAPTELEAAAASLVPHVHVNVSLVSGEMSQPLLSTLAPAVGGCSVIVSLPVPASAGRDSKVLIRGISVAGQLVTHGQSLAAHVAVSTGMLAPLRLEWTATDWRNNPLITGDGKLYVPRNHSPDVLVFSAEGTPLPPLPLDRLRLLSSTCVAAFYDAAATLLLADVSRSASKHLSLCMKRVERYAGRLN
jgi:hypothetical protein